MGGETLSFILVSRLKDVSFNPQRKEPLIFEVLRPSRIRINIQSTNPLGSSQEGFDNLECKSYLELPTSRQCANFVAHLADKIYLPIEGASISLPVRVRGVERISANGKILDGESVPFELYPLEARELVTSAWETLMSTQARFLRLLRWHQDIDAPPDLYDSEPSIYWRSSRSGNGDEHRHVSRQVSRDGELWLPTSHGIVWNEFLEQELQQLWEGGNDEPIAHELLREASLLTLNGSYRSGLLMAATAVETAVKDHIGKLRPDTHWILQNLPSPPVEKMLRKYLPDMHAHSAVISDWKLLNPLWKACGKLFEARNATAHGGADTDGPSMRQHIQTASDIIYILDVLAGRLWARQRVNFKIRDALGWPAPIEPNVFISISQPRWEIDDTPKMSS